jgi:hypothetical protein
VRLASIERGVLPLALGLVSASQPWSFARSLLLRAGYVGL